MGEEEEEAAQCVSADNEFMKHNSVVVFAVNYIQNRFVAAELCVEVGKLFEILNVKTEAEFNKAIEALRTEADTAAAVENFESVVKMWNDFIDGIEKSIVEKVGPTTTNADDDELGVGSKTISHYVKGSAFEMVLVVVVTSFNSPEVTHHIMGLYNKMDEFHKLGCDVYLLTKGPPIGARGGAYIKLIGVPFRKLYDEDEALSELKTHRHSAVELVGWESLLREATGPMVYTKLCDFNNLFQFDAESFNSPEVTHHIMGLYNKMDEFHKLGCDVYLLTKGPPIGARGGAYIKLIGVPFRKLYDEDEALSELKTHRHSAVELVGWESLLRTVEASLNDEDRPQSASKKISENQNDDQTAFITQKGGTILVDRSGNVLYKFIEDGSTAWPTIDDIFAQVKKVDPATTKLKSSVTNTAKIDSEISAMPAKSNDEKKKPCCVIL
ncbi:hypothetical protein GCK32_006475 [Trichostrongylus colubriformis]|uniref:Uncharacterized protein n=1 Tax=Trichostrongylus colubriformis TaxID=6319 RepID=A0AAN8F2R5_TRICO